MNLKIKKPVLFWSVFFIFVSLVLSLQSAFLGPISRWGPYFIWPLLLFFFLYRSGVFCLSLLFFISVFSSVFLSLSVFHVFVVYLLCFLFVFFIKTFFFSKSPLLYFTLLFLISFCFPYLIDGAYDFLINDWSFVTARFYFIKAFLTLLLSVPLFVFLKKYLQTPVTF